ncbi:receptor-type tyrosine-protein phosphatase alpha-like isoform X2 [Saccostrea cucullata]|uniref:receptor-type tyrosine-protein phosphatase alpha-like isoform X2 n=1 Tax=Saccostrea cuccullata TaxID=36930 RepID=UPI002ED123BD
METYSLTNDDNNQSWSVKLDNVYRVDWIFLKTNSEAYQVYIDLNEAPPVKCADVLRPIYTNTASLHQLILCEYPGLSTTKGNIITIKGNGPLKVFEMKPIALSPFRPNMVQNFSDFGEPVFRALDGNIDTYFQSEKGDNASWILRLDRRYEMKWILLSIRGGTYEVHIKDSDTEMNSITLCQSFTLLGLKEQKKEIECQREMTGDTIVIKRTDEGELRLFEVYPIICPSHHYGPNCAKCRNECDSCSQITGECHQCRDLFYGDFCQHECLENTTCEQTTEKCTECSDGQCCGQDVITEFISKVKDEEDPIQTTLLLAALLGLVFILISVVFVIFLKRTKNISSKEIGISMELQRVLSNDMSELEEIPQNEADYVEEEAITVEYCNLTSRRVSIEQFIKALPEKKRNGTLKKEFEDLPFGLLESHSQALKAQNIRDNRYKGIYPYDYNRVKLIKPDAAENDDYVNASYIYGFNRERSYVAAQGPFNPKTLENFWKMIWQCNSTRIVMLTNLYEGDRMKCLKYWPDTEFDIGPYTIRLDSSDVFNFYVIRHLVVQHKEDIRRVTQFHFTTWPDNSVPENLTSLICFRNLVKNGLTSTDGPIVIHCSAGIGRTGTFIALDYLLEEGAAEHTIDVKGYIASLRHQRGKSVQTFEQYIFLHDALKEGLTNNAVCQSYLSVL